MSEHSEEIAQEDFAVLRKDSPPLALTQSIFKSVLDFKDRRMGTCVICNHGGWLVGGVKCACLQDTEFFYKMACSNLPIKYREATFDKFVNQEHPSYEKVRYYADNIQTARAKGTGVHLYSVGAGTGKTLLAACLLREAARAGNWISFISMTRLLEEIKAGYDDDNKKRIIEWRMFSCDFLFLDEIEKFHPSSDWVRDRVNDLIQERVNRQLPILSSGNDSLEALARIYQGHLISRFIGTQIEILIDSSVDYRKDVLKDQLYTGLEPQDIL